MLNNETENPEVLEAYAELKFITEIKDSLMQIKN